MTRDEFRERVHSAQTLWDFCKEDYPEYSDFLEDYFMRDDLDTRVYHDIEEFRRDKMWYEMRDYLASVEDGYDLYYYNGRLDYDGQDDENIDGLISDLMDKLDEDGFFDPGFDDDEDDDDDDDDEGSVDTSSWDYAAPVPKVKQEANEPSADIQVLLFG